jgi:hypothetical protein
MEPEKTWWSQIAKPFAAGCKRAEAKLLNVLAPIMVRHTKEVRMHLDCFACLPSCLPACLLSACLCTGRV